MLLREFIPPSLYAPGRGTWRICWYNMHPQSMVLTRVQKTFNLNRIQSPRLRRAAANKLLDMLTDILNRGYNYFVDTLGFTAEKTPDELSIYMLLNEMLPIRCAGKKEKTAKSYESITAVFQRWLQDSNLAGLSAEKFAAKHFQQFINYKIREGHGNRNINDYTSFISGTLRRAVKLDYLLKNPLDKIDMLPVSDSTRFEALTADELCTIRDELKTKHIRYYLYTKFTALEFIRPYHIGFIKAADIDYEKNLIRITAATSKNRKIKYKQLMPDMKVLLLQLDYDKLPRNHYLFGNGMAFTPSATPYPSLSKRSSELWRKLVIDGLGIDKYMYALKHTAGQFYVNENDTLDAAWLQHQMEHHSLTETEKYIHNRKTKILDTSKVKLIEY